MNAVRIFNQKEVDELVIFDITSTSVGSPINFELISKMASECFMPVCYGGGVKTLDDFKALFTLGLEKVSVSSLLFDDASVVKKAVEIYGSQSIVATIDIKKSFLGSSYSIWTHSGRVKRPMPLDKIVPYCEKLGVGEMIINNASREGTWTGFDIEVLSSLTESANIPIVALGGAGSLDDIRAAVEDGGASAVCIGSMAVLQSKGMGVLIKFPKPSEIESRWTKKI